MRGLRQLILGALLLLVPFLAPAPAHAFDRLCDPAFENCRTPLIELIRNETVGIDVGFWFMEDTRYANELIARKNAGVPVRVVFDPRAYTTYGYPSARYPVELMRDNGIPMRQDTSGGIFHFKMMLFAGQGQVEFSGANFSSNAFVPVTPYENYVDEVIVFIDDPAIVNSFKTRFDDVWTATTGFSNYANVTTLQRHYPTYPIDPAMNFVPWNNFRSRSQASYKAETNGIDSIMYRITDRGHTDTIIGAIGRGVRFRLITEPQEYRNPKRLWHSWNVERLWMAGGEVKMRKHAGINHEKLSILHGQGLTIIGSSNWTSASATSQHEHNVFSTLPWMYTWSRDHFDRKWNNTGPAVETEAFVPLPPDTPTLRVPADGATDQPLDVTLTWYAGPWSHKYDVWLGTSEANMTKIVADRELGPSEHATDYVRWTVSGLAGGTTYYWRVVGRTMANVERTSATFSFRTAGTGTEEPPPTGTLPAGWSSADIGAVGAAGSASQGSGVFAVEGSGADVWGSADELHYAYHSLSGDGSITARVDSVTNTNAWTKAGVMMRETLAAGSRHAFMIVSPGKGLAFQRRTATGGASTHTSGPAGTAPYWVRLTRTGSTIQAFASTNGTAWTAVGSDTIAMGETIQVGLAVSSHVDGTLARAMFSNVSIGAAGPTPPPATLPSGWSGGDVGSVGAAGSASESGGTFTVRGSGYDVWGSADEFHWAYRSMTGDGTITARVATMDNLEPWTKVGVMMRQTLGAGSQHAFMLVSGGKGLAFQRRASAGGLSTHTSGGAGNAPAWVRLTRTGDVFSAYRSADGAAWTLVGSDTIPMGATIQVGLVTHSHRDGTLATATFDNVIVSP